MPTPHTPLSQEYGYHSSGFDDASSSAGASFRRMHEYQSLDAWKRAHEAILVVMRATDAAYHPRARPIFDQLRRAVVSVEANIVEGYALGTTPLFRRHLRIATGSAAEAECLSRVAVELGYLPGEPGAKIESLLGGSMKAIYGLMRGAIRTGK